MWQRTNRAKARIQAGEKALGVQFTFPSLHIVEMAGLLGFDYISLDAEHGTFTWQEIEQMCMVADGCGLTPMARVPDIEPSTLLRFLDRGIMGVTGPHLVTRADAEALVRACRFAPLGNRSFAGNRVKDYRVDDHLDVAAVMAHQNAEALVMGMVEDEEGLANLPDILMVDGLDMMGFGPTDLAQAMGYGGNAGHPAVQRALEQGRAQIRASSKWYSNDVMDAISVTELVIRGSREFLRQARGG